jgi:protein-disulfide isomerase
MIKKTLAIMCAALLLNACSSNEGDKATSKHTDTQAKESISSHHSVSKDSEETKVSYGIGYVMGIKLKERNININPNTFKSGLDAGLKGSSSKYTPEESKEIMMAFQQSMVKKQAEEQNKQVEAIKTAVLQHKERLLNDKNTPTVGPDNAKVTVIELFDYQCSACSKVSSTLKNVMASAQDVRYVFKDFPIFGSRWEASKYAAEVGLLAYKQGGGTLYIQYHNAIYDTGKDEGKLTNKDINKIASELKIKLGSTKSILANSGLENQLQNNIKLGAKDLGIMFTPAFIVMPTKNANASNTTIIPGYTTANDLNKAIQKAKS